MDKSELETQSEKWVEKEIISDSQRDQIVSLYSNETSRSVFSKPDDLSVRKIIAVTGGIFILAGLGSFFSLLINSYDIGLIGQSAFVYPIYALFALLPYYFYTQTKHTYITTIMAGLFTFITPFVLLFSLEVLEEFIYSVTTLQSGILLFVVSIGTTIASMYYQSKSAILSPLFTYLISIGLIIESIDSIQPYLGGSEWDIFTILTYSIILYTTGYIVNQDSHFKSLLTWIGAIPLLGFTVSMITFPFIYSNGITSTPIIPQLILILSISVITYGYSKRNINVVLTKSVLSLVILTGIAMSIFSFSTEMSLALSIIYILLYGIVNMLVLISSVKTQSLGLFNVGSIFFIWFIGDLYHQYIVESLGGVISFTLLGIVLLICSMYLKEQDELVGEIKQLYMREQ